MHSPDATRPAAPAVAGGGPAPPSPDEMEDTTIPNASAGGEAGQRCQGAVPAPAYSFAAAAMLHDGSSATALPSCAVCAGQTEASRSRCRGTQSWKRPQHPVGLFAPVVQFDSRHAIATAQSPALPNAARICASYAQRVEVDGAGAGVDTRGVEVVRACCAFAARVAATAAFHVAVRRASSSVIAALMPSNDTGAVRR